jgi:hypothetical protein
MNGKIPGAKFRSARGTTLKTFNWRAAAEKSPLSRQARRRARVEQAQAARVTGELVPARPRYSGVTTAIDPTHTPPTPQLDAETAAVIEQAREAWERRRARDTAGERAGPAPLRSSAVERPPPE